MIKFWPRQDQIYTKIISLTFKSDTDQCQDTHPLIIDIFCFFENVTMSNYGLDKALRTDLHKVKQNVATFSSSQQVCSTKNFLIEMSSCFCFMSHFPCLIQF